MFKKFHPIIWTIIGGTALSRTAFYMVMPFLAIYLNSKGISAATIGGIIGVSFLFGTIGGFFGSLLSDKVGRYPILMISITTYSLVFLLYIFADSVIAFFILNALNGLCRSVFEPTIRALLSDVTPEEQRASAFSLRYYATNVGSAIGPIIGVYLGSSGSTSPFLITSITYTVYGLLLWHILKKFGFNKMTSDSSSISFGNTLKVISTDKIFGLFLLANIFSVTAISHTESTLAQYLGNTEDILNGVKYYSYLLATNSICVLILQYPLIAAVKKIPPLKVMIIGNLLYALGLFGFGVFRSLLMLLLMMLVFTIGEILTWTMADIVVSEIAPSHLRGTYFGAINLQFIGQSIGPWVGGMLLGLLGFNEGLIVFGLLSIIVLSATPIYWFLSKKFNLNSSFIK